jgi:hypothetical protein
MIILINASCQEFYSEMCWRLASGGWLLAAGLWSLATGYWPEARSEKPAAKTLT